MNGVYIKVDPGTVCGLFGKNGCGKSTLFKIGAGQLRANSGLTVIDGQCIRKKAVDRRFSKIGYLPQKSMLPRGMSVKTVLGSFPTDKKEREGSFIKKIISQNIADLSNGERRYLEVTLLFSLDRDYFLLDEPFTGIEPLIIELLIKKISRKAEAGSGILITDHYYQYLLQVADQGYLMKNKQCYDLENDLKSNLKSMGYIK